MREPLLLVLPHTVHVHRVREIVPDEKLVFPVRDGSLTNHDPTEQARTEVETSQAFGQKLPMISRPPQRMLFSRENLIL